MKKIFKHGIAIIGIAVLVYSAFGCLTIGPSVDDPKEAAANYRKGHEYSEKGDYDQAIVEFTEAIRLNPNFKNAYSYRARVYSEKEDYDSAIADYDKSLQLRPDSAAYNNRGYAYMNKGDYDRAIADFDKVIQLDPKKASAYYYRAWVYAYHLKKDFNRAISDANQAVNLSPNNSSYFGARGWAYLGNGDYDKAIADFEKSLQINSNNNFSIEGLTQARLARIKPEPVKDDDFEVRQNADNTITITGYKGAARNVIIPDTLYGLKVTIIGNRAFQGKNLFSVVIPDTVVTIENGRITSLVRCKG